jgi:hypothetical protein
LALASVDADQFGREVAVAEEDHGLGLTMQRR